MPEGLSTADGQKIDLDNVDREFAAAMAAPPADDPEHPAPPDIGPVDPEAPYGRKVDGSPKKAPGGRPPKARTTVKAIEAGGSQKDSKDGKGGGDAVTYAKALEEFLGGVALALAVIPVPNDELRVRCRVQAHVLKETGDGLAAGLGACAEHNSVVRWGVEKLTKGGGAWVFPAALAVAPFAVQTAAVWRAPVEGDMRAAADRIQEESLAEFKASMGMNSETADADRAA